MFDSLAAYTITQKTNLYLRSTVMGVAASSRGVRDGVAPPVLARSGSIAVAHPSAGGAGAGKAPAVDGSGARVVDARGAGTAPGRGAAASAAAEKEASASVSANSAPRCALLAAHHASQRTQSM